MISTDDLAFFLAIAGADSLAAAARMLDVTPPAVSQRLQALEDKVGIRLVDRSRRGGEGIALTSEGELFIERGRAILDEIGNITEALSVRQETVSGHLRISAPLGFGRQYVAPAAGQFHYDHPKISLDVELSTDPEQVKSDAYDVIIHIGEVRRQSSLMRRIAPNERFVCASPAYLRRRGIPQTPGELKHHECMALRQQDEHDATMWRFQPKNAAHDAESVRIKAVLASNDGSIVKEWAVAGHGVVVRSEWDVADDIRAGRLVRLLTEYTLPSADVVALLDPDRRSRAARTNAFLEFFRQTLTPPPWRAVHRPAKKKKRR